MICFPLDNTEYEAIALGAWQCTRTRGVYADDGHYNVSVNGDMTITVSPGLGWLKRDTYWGINAYEPNARTFTLETADGSLTRFDSVVVQLDKNTNKGDVVIKTGAYGTAPKLEDVPLPVRNLDYDEIVVFAVKVRAGATEILASDIYDLRLDEDYCGIMRDGVTGIPTQALYDQWRAWMADFTDEAQAYYGNYQNMVADLFMQYTASIATHEENAGKSYDAYIDSLEAYKTAAKTDWEAWVASLKDILDEETAGHLQLEIEELQRHIPTVTLGTVNTLSATPQIYALCCLYKTSWGFGVGGAGVGPAGGGSTVAIDVGLEYVGDGNVIVTAPAEFGSYTQVNQLSDTMYAFATGAVDDMTCLVLRILKEA